MVNKFLTTVVCLFLAGTATSQELNLKPWDICEGLEKDSDVVKCYYDPQRILVRIFHYDTKKELVVTSETFRLAEKTIKKIINRHQASSSGENALSEYEKQLKSLDKQLADNDDFHALCTWGAGACIAGYGLAAKMPHPYLKAFVGLGASACAYGSFSCINRLETKKHKLLKEYDELKEKIAKEKYSAGGPGAGGNPGWGTGEGDGGGSSGVEFVNCNTTRVNTNGEKGLPQHLCW